MQKRIWALLLAALLVLGLCGCGGTVQVLSEAEDQLVLISEEPAAPRTALPSETSAEASADSAVPEESDIPEDSEDGGEMPVDPSLTEAEPDAGEDLPEFPWDGGDGDGEADAESSVQVVEGQEYSTPEEVALYLHTYGKLPPNYISKNKARDLGWDNSQGNLWDVAPGKSIGGDRFGNYEGLLPDTTKYRECDVNYDGGYRGAERLIYGEDGSIYYTDDHYNTFTRLY